MIRTSQEYPFAASQECEFVNKNFVMEQEYLYLPRADSRVRFSKGEW
jgi:hypothetical protein